MAERNSKSLVPTPSAEQRRIATENFERARQVILTGNYDYGITLLKVCCQIDPANFLYRQSLRRAQKEKFGNNLRGSRLAFFTTPGYKAKIKAAKANRDYLKLLEHAEEVLTRNPWDLGTQMDMAEAFDALGLLDHAVFSLDQARQKYPRDATLNRAMARLLEKRGDFQKAIALWQLVRELVPTDVEAAHKAKDLAASETIKRGGYEKPTGGTGESAVVQEKLEAAGAKEQDKLTRDTEPLLKRLEANPTEPSLYVQLSQIYRRHQQPDRAKAALQQGLGPTGQHFSLQLELLELELAPFRTNLEHAEARLKELKAKKAAGEEIDDDTSEELVKLRSKLAKEVSQREIEILRVKAERFPNDHAHRLELGVRLLKADRVDEAIAELQQAKKDEKLKSRALMYLGLGFRKRNNWKLAQRNFEEALQTLTSSSEESTRKEVLFHLASGCAENGELPRAVELGLELANLDFAYKNIATLLDDWQTTLQKA